MRNLIICVAMVGLFTNTQAQQQVEPFTVGDAYALTAVTYDNTPFNVDLSSLPAFQQGDEPGRTKNITKTFPADQTDKINLSNQYGSMTIKVWNKREVKIDISIVAISDNEREADKLIDEVNIDAGKNGDVISCKTTIGSDNHWGGNFRIGKNRKREIKINYVVYMPVANALTLSQQYGNVNMDDFSGPLSAQVQYGDFNAGKLADDNNYVKVQYGKTTIEELNKATIKQQYGSGLFIGIAGELNLSAQYANVTINTIKKDAVIKQQYGSGLKIGSVGNLDLNVQYANANITTIRGNAVIKQQYNSISIGSVGRLDLKSQYADVNITLLRGDGIFKTSYNHFNISEITGACRNLDIDADYADVNLNFSDSYNGDFTLQKSYGGFKYGANVKATVSGDDEDRRGSSSKRYSGKIGNGGNANVTIKAAYGSVVFK